MQVRISEDASKYVQISGNAIEVNGHITIPLKDATYICAKLINELPSECEFRKLIDHVVKNQVDGVLIYIISPNELNLELYFLDIESSKLLEIAKFLRNYFDIVFTVIPNNLIICSVEKKEITKSEIVNLHTEICNLLPTKTKPEEITQKKYTTYAGTATLEYAKKVYGRKEEF